MSTMNFFSTNDLTRCGLTRKLEAHKLLIATLTSFPGPMALHPLPKDAVMNTSFLRIELSILIGQKKSPHLVGLEPATF